MSEKVTEWDARLARAGGVTEETWAAEIWTVLFLIDRLTEGMADVIGYGPGFVLTLTDNMGDVIASYDQDFLEEMQVEENLVRLIERLEYVAEKEKA